MSGARNIPSKGTGNLDIASSLATSFRSASPFAQEILARDIAECSDDEEESDTEAVEAEQDSEGSLGDLPGLTLYRRPSGVAFGTGRPVLGLSSMQDPVLTRVERKQSRNEERSLLRDNHFLPPKHPPEENRGFLASIYKRLFSTKVPVKSEDEETPRIVIRPTETSPLLADGADQDGSEAHGNLDEQWEAAVASGKIKTTWQREAKTIAVYSRSLIITFLLQYSINVASVFAIKHFFQLAVCLEV